MRRRRCPHPHRGGRPLHHGASPREWPVRSPLNMLLCSSLSNLLERSKLRLSNCAERLTCTPISCIDVAWVFSARFANNSDRAVGSEYIVRHGRAIGSRAVFSKVHSIVDYGFDPGLYLGFVRLRQD